MTLDEQFTEEKGIEKLAYTRNISPEVIQTYNKIQEAYSSNSLSGKLLAGFSLPLMVYLTNNDTMPPEGKAALALFAIGFCTVFLISMMCGKKDDDSSPEGYS